VSERAKKPLRVLIVSPRFYPYQGGVQTHVYEVSRRLVRAGADVTVLTTTLDPQLPAEDRLEDVNIRRVRAWPAKRDYYFAPAIGRVIAQGDWDIVHVQSYHTLVAPMAMLAALRANIPYILTFHGGGHSSRLRQALRQIQWLVLRPLLARASRLVATARFETPLYARKLRLPPEQFVFIPNGADLGAALPSAPVAEQTTLSAADRTLIASVGRLERYKGHHRVIEALPALLEHEPNLHLWVAGAGPYEQDLWQLAQRLGVDEHIEIRAIPPVDRQAFARELSRAALVTLLSEYETHPMAALEAIALGRPLLVADTSGLSELAQQGFARAIPLNSSPEEVAAAMLGQLRAPLLPGRIALPTWDACANELLALYHEVLQKRRALEGPAALPRENFS
jgi:glycosyltransferase involved in cell wall biosynthesis